MLAAAAKLGPVGSPNTRPANANAKADANLVNTNLEAGSAQPVAIKGYDIV